MKFKIDTGAQVNTLTKSCLNELNTKFTINKFNNIKTGDSEIIKSVNKGPANYDPSFMVNTNDKEIGKLILEFSDIFEGIGQLVNIRSH